VLVATVLHGAVNGFGSLIGSTIPQEEGIWFLLASAVLVAAALLLLDGRMWFAQPTETMNRNPIPSAA
jgi:hypothetical protein